MRHKLRSEAGRPYVRQLCVALLAVLAVTAAVASCGRAGTERAPTARPQQAVASTHSTTADLRPTRLTIPRIKVRTSVVQLGLNKDGTVEVPADPDQVGWYHLGSLPGRSGSAVILGHVDSKAGPAVFYRLRLLKLGATIDIERADGTHLQFEVDSIATYPNAKFPAAKVYRIDGPPQLTLITCAGDYDASNGGYQANLVVSARLVGSAHD